MWKRYGSGQSVQWDDRSKLLCCVIGGCLLSLSLCRRGFQDLLKVRAILSVYIVWVHFKFNSDFWELPRIKQATCRTRRKFETKNFNTTCCSDRTEWHLKTHIVIYTVRKEIPVKSHMARFYVHLWFVRCNCDVYFYLFYHVWEITFFGIYKATDKLDGNLINTQVLLQVNTVE
jgi:hypothetical protein